MAEQVRGDHVGIRGKFRQDRIPGGTAAGDAVDQQNHGLAVFTGLAVADPVAVQGDFASFAYGVLRLFLGDTTTGRLACGRPERFGGSALRLRCRTFERMTPGTHHRNCLAKKWVASALSL